MKYGEHHFPRPATPYFGCATKSARFTRPDCLNRSKDRPRQDISRVWGYGWQAPQPSASVVAFTSNTDCIPQYILLLKPTLATPPLHVLHFFLPSAQPWMPWWLSFVWPSTAAQEWRSGPSRARSVRGASNRVVLVVVRDNPAAACAQRAVSTFVHSNGRHGTFLLTGGNEGQVVTLPLQRCKVCPTCT